MVYTAAAGGGYTADRMPLTLQSLHQGPKVPRAVKKGPLLLQEELLNMGVDYSRPQKSHLGFEARLPLSWFDDTDYEMREPHEWVASFRKAGRRADGLALVTNGRGVGTWCYMKVHKYAAAEGKYLVTVIDEQNSMDKPAYLEHRVNLFFSDERMGNFAKRVASAHMRRVDAEEDLLRRFYVENMPTTELRTLSVKQITRILELAYSTEQLRQAHPDPTPLVEETRREYARTLNSLLFKDELKVPALRSQVKLTRLDPELKLSAPDLGVVPPWLPGAYAHGECAASFESIAACALPEAVRAMLQARYECLQLQKLSLYTLDLTQSIRLEDFEQMQMQHVMRFVQFLRDSWQPTVKKGVLSAIVDAGPAWRQLAPRPSVYDTPAAVEVGVLPDEDTEDPDLGSRPRRMTRAINLMAADALRIVTNTSLEAYADYICEHAARRLFVEDPELLNEAPLFLLDLVCHSSELFFSTSAEFFVSVPVRLVDEGVKALMGLRPLDPFDLSFGKPTDELGELPTVAGDEPQVAAIKERMTKALQESTAPLAAFLESFSKHLDHIQLDVQAYVKDFAAADQEEDKRPTLPQMRQKVSEHLAARARLEKEVPQLVGIGMYLISVAQVRQMMLEKHTHVADLVLQLIDIRAREAVVKLNTKFAEMHVTLQEQPKDIERLTELKVYMVECAADVDSMQEAIGDMMKHYDVLEDFRHDVSREDMSARWQVFHWPSRMHARIEESTRVMEEDRATFYNVMLAEQKQFDRALDDLKFKVDHFGEHAELARVDTIFGIVRDIEATIADFQAKATQFSSREELFDKEDRTDYEILERISKDFEPFSSLWTNAHNWTKWHAKWLDGPLADLDPDDVDKSFGDAQKAMVRAVKSFKDQAGCLAIASQLKEEMAGFAPFVPLVKALRDKGMRDRHWDALTAELGFDLHLSSSFTLRDATDGLQLHQPKTLETVERTCDKARKEYSIEKTLNEMQEAWEQLNFEVMPYRNTGTGVIKLSEDVNTVLDDHIVLTQQFSFSPFKEPFEERIAAWERQLRLVQDITTEWLACQRNWMYLQPIFDSEDINRQLPAEGKRFAGVDRNWRKTVDRVQATPNIVQFCDDVELLRLFSKANEELERVQKNLADYLETKRAGFARFYFLSNDELISILSQTKDPAAVQPHLRKCFEAVNRISMKGPENTMTNMISAEKETVDFVEPLQPKGSVEFWMGDIERMMQRSVRKRIELSLADYRTPNQTRGDFCLKWEGMVVLAATGYYWTQEVEEALADSTTGVRQYHARQLEQLKELSSLVRTKLSSLQSKTMAALIVMEVHARDVVEQLIDVGIERSTDFEWVSQLRYYWEEAPTDFGNDNLLARMVQCTFPYGYEYLGNSSRLVVTPLTDKCYMTLMGALHMHLGGAPAGPAGTGKTESVKDLAKALAKQCVVFNCSDGLDYKSMGRFFKGIATAGAWACFDEFNRIDIEVLSVVAQQILTITNAIIDAKTEFEFEGTIVKLNPTCSVFITMNPGYAGRTELPDNLKVLFRPVAMMVPDYALIGEIRLFSFGFDKPRVLAQKLVGTFRLSSEQLSSQDHYDFGMRAVNTVIQAAGILKRTQSQMEEDLIMLRAIRDSNMPKFLRDDIILFRSIISDLFPGVEEPKAEYPELEAAIREVAAEFELQCVPEFMLKCIQLYEMTVVRHGMMLVGPTGGGKTRVLRVLQGAISKLKDVAEDFETVRVYLCNPKSITQNQLYGAFDLQTGEWTDGIAATLIRHMSQPNTEETGVTEYNIKWMMFDGPVDAVWIENMNTVLDDNKKLCLTSGEIIPLAPTNRMMFEVEDLAVASPATVSRCGMIFAEPGYLLPESRINPGSGLRPSETPLLKSWLHHLPEPLVKGREALGKLFDHYMHDGLELVRLQLRQTVPAVQPNQVAAVMRVLDSILLPLLPQEGLAQDVADTAAKRLATALETTTLAAIFLYALIWSLGAVLAGESRGAFDAWLRGAGGPYRVSPELPKTGLVFDHYLDLEFTPRWVKWSQTQAPYEIPEKTDFQRDFSSIIVPTDASICYASVLELLLTSHKHTLCVGPTGTAKSVTVQQKLSRGMPDCFEPILMAFSAQTSANQTQSIIDGKFEKRRQGVDRDTGLAYTMWGPVLGKRFNIFIDDFNMPKREIYGAQPPLELLRTAIDVAPSKLTGSAGGGWYDLKSLKWRAIVDVTLVGAMGPPGGGRNPVSNRMLRHMHFLSFVDMSDEVIGTIFGTILRGLCAATFPDLTDLADPLVTATVGIYHTVCEQLLPTPAKSHYTFNLRDISKVVQGVCMADKRRTQDRRDLVRTWLHECMRVFSDRLVNDEDRTWFDSVVHAACQMHFKVQYDQVVPAGQRLIYCDFYTPNQDPRIYEQVTDYSRLEAACAEALRDYNELHMPMHLVLFTDAMEHVCKVCRVLRQPGGNALLLGVGGSGRQSLTKLAVHIAEFELFTVEITKSYGLRDWRDNLKQVLSLAGHDGKHVAFLFADTQIVNELFLENINNILSSGEVPNLFDDADLGPIFEKVTPQLQLRKVPISKTNLYAAFVEQIRAKIHIVLAMSPLSEAYRNRIRQFPSLVNCCTIDWFSPWPEVALSSVARTNLASVESQIKPEEYPGVIKMCVLMHQSVEHASRRYMEEMQRYNQVTPTSYLSLLSVLKSTLSSRYTHLSEQRNRLVIGLEKLASTKEQVADLQAQLEANQPILERTKLEVEQQQVQIAQDKEEAAVVQVDAEAAAEAASSKAAECEAIKASAEEGLAKALPALDEAVKSLSKLKKDQIVEIKALKKPPAGVKLVMKGVCIMFEIKPGKTTDPDTGQKVDDWWGASQKLMNDLGPDKLKQRLVEFDKDSIKEATIKVIDPICDDRETFSPEVISKVSVACEAMCMWVHAMRTYYYVSKEVEPKRRQLAEATEQLNEATASRDAAAAKLKAVTDRVAKLEADLAAAIDKKAQLEDETERCTRQLENAEKLLSGLGGEAANWDTQSTEFKRQMDGVAGDVMICAALISYLGPFVATYRNELVSQWKQALEENKVPYSKGVSAHQILATPVEVRQWNIDGLPADTFSIENGCIMARTPRWPLLIDPQGQANKFIKTSQAALKLKAVKASDSAKKITQSLESGIRFGTPVLLENALEVLDPFLEPVLLNQTYMDTAGQLVIKLGDNVIPYHSDFRFSLTTVIPNPHYAPEVQVKVTLINFTITPDGLEEQLLGIVVATERPDLSELKNRLVVEGAENRRKLSELQSDILYMLSNSQGNILDDTKLIDTLGVSKVTSEQIQVALAEAEKAETEIDETRDKYVPVAFRGSVLFFAIADLSLIDPMYQYSLSWFTHLFVSGIGRAEASDDLQQRLANVNDYVTYSLYVNVCRSLFETHKLMFSFLICIKILMGAAMVDMAEWRFLLAGGMATGELHAVPRPDAPWLNDKAWLEVINLSALPKFVGLDKDVSNDSEPWRAIIDSTKPQEEPLPGRWDDSLDLLQKMLILRAFRPDKVIPAVQNFVRHHLGQHFIEPPPFDLGLAYPDSSPTLPLIFVLSSGADPVKVLREYARDVGMAEKLDSISLGQGQGPKAEKMIKDGKENGRWVLLMNCHLFQSWMVQLEKEVEDIELDKTNPDFRLWLTSMPSKFFPVSVLQNGVKMTFEPPKGLRLNLRTALTQVSEEAFASTRTPGVWRKVMFALMLFHATILERRKFGPLGWNISYEFTDGDRDVCIMQARMLVDEYDDPPWKVLNILTAVVNYGGRVTDTWDIRLIGNLLRAYLNENVTRDGYSFTASGVYRSIDAEDRQRYLDYVAELPVNASPEAFGLHDNADITCAQNETFELFTTILKLQPRQTSGGGKSRDEVIADVATDIQTRVTNEFDYESATVKYPTMYEESMNTVLQQEIIRYNKLLKVLHASLKSIKKAIRGEVVMSEELEQMGTSLFNNQVPAMWAAKAYPSLKPLAAWVNDLKDRTTFVQNWFDEGKPTSFWISGFYFPQAFLTGTLQNYARKHQLPIDTISWGYAVVDTPYQQLQEPPAVGVYIYGLFIEGATWDPAVKLMAEARPKELYAVMPVVNLQPTPNRIKPKLGIYTCPTYKTVARFGVLSTTGHSTNYVMPIEIPTDKDEGHWINRGVALVTQLRY